jgi:HEPN domain-containing protein/predicted nucleotidyltransferase
MASTQARSVDEIIQEMTRRIVERFDPLQVILFGSQARGDAHADSDVDLLVVFPHVENTRLAAVAILDELSGLGISKDVVVSTPDEISARGHLIGNVLEPALREGRILYQLSAVGAGANSSGLAREAERWLRQGRDHLKFAEGLIEVGDDAPHIVCFHAQQAAEKAIKAILVFLQIRFPFRHDLDEVRDLVPVGWDILTAHPNLTVLSQWATTGRYPGNWPEATDTDARDAARQARAVWETVLDDLDRHGLDVSAFR